MKVLFIAALALSLIFGLGTRVSADDAHHPEKQAKAKSTAKKAVKKPTKKPTKNAPLKKNVR